MPLSLLETPNRTSPRPGGVADTAGALTVGTRTGVLTGAGEEDTAAGAAATATGEAEVPSRGSCLDIVLSEGLVGVGNVNEINGLRWRV